MVFFENNGNILKSIGTADVGLDVIAKEVGLELLTFNF